MGNQNQFKNGAVDIKYMEAAVDHMERQNKNKKSAGEIIDNVMDGDDAPKKKNPFLKKIETDDDEPDIVTPEYEDDPNDNTSSPCNDKHDADLHGILDEIKDDFRALNSNFAMLELKIEDIEKAINKTIGSTLNDEFQQFKTAFKDLKENVKKDSSSNNKDEIMAILKYAFDMIDKKLLELSNSNKEFKKAIVNNSNFQSRGMIGWCALFSGFFSLLMAIITAIVLIFLKQ